MKNLYKFLAIVLILFSTVVNAQREDLTQLNKFELKRLNKQAMKANDYSVALTCCELLVAKDVQSPEIMYQTAELYYKSGTYRKAQEMYSKVFQLDSENFPHALFYRAMMKKINGDLTGAEKDFEDFYTKFRGRPDMYVYAAQAKIQIEGCKLSAELLKYPNKVSLTRLNSAINNGKVQLSPILINDSTLIYAGQGEENNEGSYETQLPTSKFYKAIAVDNEWVLQGELEGPYNNSEQSTGNGSYSQDGQHFYFTHYKQNNGASVSEIYLSKEINGIWQQPEKLDDQINMPKYTNTQPSVGVSLKKNCEVLYFASNRPGGKGGMDIWFAVFNEKLGHFEKPRNAGNRINTMGDEITPFYDNSTRSLYFSSNGLPGIGGFDVFKTNGGESRWSVAINQGIPVNSVADDLYYVLGADKKDGFLVSNRQENNENGIGNDNIYAFVIDDYIQISISGQLFAGNEEGFVNYIKQKITGQQQGSIKSINDYKALSEANVSLYLLDTDSGEPILIQNNQADVSGNFSCMLEKDNEYNLVIEKHGYFPRQIDLSTNQQLVGSNLRIDSLIMDRIPTDAIHLSSFNYSFNETDLSSESKYLIDNTVFALLEEFPELKIEISSYTDNIGDETYNLELSQLRSENVIKYLAGKGISENRLIAKGLGEQNPLVANILQNGTDNPEGRSQNRRTEIRIIGGMESLAEAITKPEIKFNTIQ